jgi:MFS family permease
MVPTLNSYVSKNTEMSRRGGIMGIASSAQLLANMAGPTAGGILAAEFGLRETFFITGGALVAALLFVRSFFVDMRGSDNPLPDQPIGVAGAMPPETHD